MLFFPPRYYVLIVHHNAIFVNLNICLYHNIKITRIVGTITAFYKIVTHEDQLLHNNMDIHIVEHRTEYR